MRRDGEPETQVHAARVALHRRVEETLDVRERHDLVELPVDLALLMPGWRRSGRRSRGRSARDGSRCPPRAASRRAPAWSRYPAVGSVIRERILRRVLLPAPLRPMIPTHFSLLELEDDVVQRPDQSVVSRPLPRRDGAAAPPQRDSARRPHVLRRWPMRYCLPRPSTGTATSLISDHVRERALDAPEVERPDHEQHDGGHERDEIIGTGAVPVRAAPSGSPRPRSAIGFRRYSGRHLGHQALG